MYKKIVFLGSLLAGSSTTAMELTQKVDENQVKIYVGEEQDVVTLPVDYAKLIGALELVDAPVFNNNGFPLRGITLQVWKLIAPHLERLYGITHDVANADTLRQAIFVAFGTLEGNDLIEVIRAADYLAIPLLLKIACEVVRKSAPGKIASDDIASLPQNLHNHLILDKIVTLVGVMPPALELVKSQDTFNKVPILIASGDGTMDALNTTELEVCRGHKSWVNSVCVSQREGKIISGSDDKTVRVWGMNGYELAICRGIEAPVKSVCATKDAKIVSGSWDGTMSLWNIQGMELLRWKGHEKTVCSLCVTKDGTMVSGSFDETVRVWNKMGESLAMCKGHEGPVLSVYITNDCKIVSGSADGTVRVWNMKGKELAVCEGHRGWVISVYVSNDGKIVSVSVDGTVRVWDMEGNQLAVCRNFEEVHSACLKLAVCPGEGWVLSYMLSNGFIISSSVDGLQRVWDSSLYARIGCMSKVQAKTTWELLQKIASQDEGNKWQSWWKEIEKILNEEPPAVNATPNNATLNNDNNNDTK